MFHFQIKVLLVAFLSLECATAFPGLTLGGITVGDSSTTTTSDATETQAPANTNGHNHPLTAHTEATQTLLQLPTQNTTPQPTQATIPVETITADSESKSKAHQSPQTAHDEESQSALQLATTPVIVQPSSSAEQNTIIFIAPATSAVPTVEQSHAKSTAAVLQMPTVPATTQPPAQLITSPVVIVSPNGAPFTPQPATNTISIFTSQGVVYSTTMQAQTSGAAFLRSSQSGAVGILAGSAPVTIGGTTYSVAAGGSAIYINGVSSALPMSTKTDVAAHVSWTTSGSILMSNGIPYTGSSIPTVTWTTKSGVLISNGVSYTGSVIPSETSFKTTASSTSASSKIGATATATASSGLQTGSASSNAPLLYSISATIMLTWLGICF